MKPKNAVPPKASQVEMMLSRPLRKVERVKSSFNLDRTLVDGFRALCDARDITQSELLEAMLGDLLDQHRPD